VLAAVLVFRVGLPLLRTLRHRPRVVDVRREPGGAVTLTVAGERLDRLGARAGQYLVWRFLDGRGWTRGHPYSLSAAPTGDRLRVTVAGPGDGAVRAAAVPVGTRVLLEGPYGGFTFDRRRHRGLLMLAAGIGVTPFVALVEAGRFAPGEAVLVVRVRDVERAALLDELRPLCAERGVALHVVAEPLDLARLVPDLAERDVYVCGPPAWVAALSASVRGAGVAARDVHTESFGSFGSFG
jgi:ferredoxin-NADP reductase